MNAALKVWLLAHWIKVALALIAAWLVVTQLRSCSKDKSDSTDAAVMAERLRVDSAEKAQFKAQHSQDSANLAERDRQLTLALANGTKVVTQWRESAPSPIKAGSAHDTASQLATQLKTCRDDGNALAQSVLGIKSACEAYRDTAKVALAHDSTRYAQLEKSYGQLDSLRRIEQRGKRIQSYGDLLYEPLKQRPVLGLGITSKMFWKIDAKAEAQYAIPRAKPDSTDGLRLVVGAHLRF